MASEQIIKKAIKERVESSKVANYSNWTIGITTDPEGRKNQHDNPKYWKI